MTDDTFKAEIAALARVRCCGTAITFAQFFAAVRESQPVDYVIHPPQTPVALKVAWENLETVQ